MVEFCIEHDFTLRFIETMPVGSTGCNTKDSHCIDLEVIRRELEQRFDLIPSVMPGGGPARYFKVRGPISTLALSPRSLNTSARPATGSAWPPMEPSTCVWDRWRNFKN